MRWTDSTLHLGRSKIKSVESNFCYTASKVYVTVLQFHSVLYIICSKSHHFKNILIRADPEKL